MDNEFGNKSGDYFKNVGLCNFRCNFVSFLRALLPPRHSLTPIQAPRNLDTELYSKAAESLVLIFFSPSKHYPNSISHPLSRAIATISVRLEASHGC